MKSRTTKFIRGQVWFIRDKFRDAVGSEQDKDRPWLIVSNNTCNQNSPVIQIVPLTTRTSDGYPMHVFFTNNEGRPQIIECEQIMTVDTRRLTNSSYMYTLDPEILVKVDKALVVQLGLETSYQSAVTNMDSKIDKTFRRLFHDFDGKMSASDFIEFVVKFNKSYDEQIERIKKLPTPLHNQVVACINNPPKKEDKSVKSIISSDTTDKSTPKTSTTRIKGTSEEKQDTPPTSSTLNKTKSGRNRWTDKMKRQYIADSKVLSLSDLAKKYGLSSSAVAAQYKYKFINYQDK